MSDTGTEKKLDGGLEINISSSPPRDAPYAGMSKEELQKFSQDPFWVRLRWVLFILFWLVWIGLIAGAIAIIATTPQCEVSVDRWWRSAIFYQIYPRSFQDSNNDGDGDIKGIERRVDYLKEVGVGAVWLNPIYVSPEADNGYDVQDYRQIDEKYGTLEDMETLIDQLHDNGVKVIMDFIPNHTSNMSEWFIASQANASDDNPYRDYYVWRDGRDGGRPPNNWISVFGGPAWSYVASRGQWYLHQFKQEQPDLNLRNAAVRQELQDILGFWLDKEVDGFRVDAVKHCYEDQSFADESPSLLTTDTTDYNYLHHNLTVDQPETYDLVKQWVEFVKGYGSDRVLITEAYNDDVKNVMQYYDYGVDIPFNFGLVSQLTDDEDKCPSLSQCVYDGVTEWMDNMPSGQWPNWVVGNHDNKRVSSRIGAQFVNAVNMLLLLLPGTPTVYYGEEIGMQDNTDLYPDPWTVFNREYCRTPMQWDRELNAGFSNHTPWLPVNRDFTDRNVQVQRSNPTSNFNLYKNLTVLRQHKSFVEGESHFSNKSGPGLVAFTRKADGDHGYLVILHFGSATVDYDANELKVTSGQIVLSTPNVLTTTDTSDLVNKKLQVRAGDGLVIKYD